MSADLPEAEQRAKATEAATDARAMAAQVNAERAAMLEYFDDLERETLGMLERQIHHANMAGDVGRARELEGKRARMLAPSTHPVGKPLSVPPNLARLPKNAAYLAAKEQNIGRVTVGVLPHVDNPEELIAASTIIAVECGRHTTRRSNETKRIRVAYAGRLPGDAHWRFGATKAQALGFDDDTDKRRREAAVFMAEMVDTGGNIPFTCHACGERLIMKRDKLQAVFGPLAEHGIESITLAALRGLNSR